MSKQFCLVCLKPTCCYCRDAFTQTHARSVLVIEVFHPDFHHRRFRLKIFQGKLLDIRICRKKETFFHVARAEVCQLRFLISVPFPRWENSLTSL